MFAIPFTLMASSRRASIGYSGVFPEPVMSQRPGQCEIEDQGFPAWANLKLAGFALWPVGKMIVPMGEARHQRYRGNAS
jgi:hypothetical protein